MMQVGEIHVFVSDMAVSLRFWADGLGLQIAEQELTHTTGFAMLEFPDGGPCVRLFSGAEPWPEGQRPMAGSRPTIRFDIATTEFDATLARLLESGGRQLDEIETYSGVRFVTVADPDGNSFELVELPDDA